MWKLHRKLNFSNIFRLAVIYTWAPTFKNTEIKIRYNIFYKNDFSIVSIEIVHAKNTYVGPEAVDLIGSFRVLSFRTYFVFANLLKSCDFALFLGIVISTFIVYIAGTKTSTCRLQYIIM